MYENTLFYLIYYLKLISYTDTYSSSPAGIYEVSPQKMLATDFSVKRSKKGEDRLRLRQISSSLLRATGRG